MNPRAAARRTWVLAAGAGIALATGLAPLHLWPLSLVTLVAIGALFLKATSARQAAWTGWIFGAAYFAVAFSWIVEPFLVDIPRHGWMAPFALILTAGGMALFWALAFWMGYRLARSPAGRLLGLILAWSLAEFARAYVLSGLPWAALAQIWPGTPVALLLAWVGPHGLAALTLAATLPLALLLCAETRHVMAGLPLILTCAAVWASASNAPPVTQTGATVRLIQPNAPQHQKWHPDFIWGFFDRQVRYTAAGGAEARPDLIVWPESSIPPFLHNATDTLTAISQAAQGVPVVAGIRRREAQRIYNSLIVIGAAGTVAQTYDKHHLVPFGEYVPLGGLLSRIGITGFASENGQGYSAGPGPRMLDLGSLGLAVPLICYEAVFPHDVNGAPARGRMLLQITNDAWFGQINGPYQHLAQARMRAIEQGLPMVRVANTGISAVIDPRGGIVDHLPLGEAGYLDVALPAPHAPTVYSATGDLPLFAGLVALTLGLGALQIRHRPRNSN